MNSVVLAITNSGRHAMTCNFKACNSDQVYLLPPTLQEWLPPKHLVWLILDDVAEMDLMAFYRKYRKDGKGQAAFEPSMMVSPLYFPCQRFYSLVVAAGRPMIYGCINYYETVNNVRKE